MVNIIHGKGVCQLNVITHCRTKCCKDIGRCKAESSDATVNTRKNKQPLPGGLRVFTLHTPLFSLNLKTLITGVTVLEL